MNPNKNWNCDGDRCRQPHGEVRKYPLGAGGNLMLCYSCFAHENYYRHVRGVQTGEPANWPEVNWSTAEVYGGATLTDEDREAMAVEAADKAERRKS
jgi:hypothetical protein